MNTKKHSIIIAALFIFLPLFLLEAHSAQAAAKAIFPDARRAQPPPAGVEPNISHNIQDHGIVAPGIVPLPPTPEASATAEPAPVQTHSNKFWWWTFGILAAIGAGWIIIRQIRGSSNGSDDML